MNDDERSLYGWEMRLLQIEENIYNLENKKKEIQSFVDDAKERLKQKWVDKNE